MLSRIARRAARLLLHRIPDGAEVGERAALDRLNFGVETVIKGYLNGFFPMFAADGAVRWMSPAERCVIPINEFHVPKNLARIVRRGDFEIRVDTQFERVVDACSAREDAWITRRMRAVYSDLHRMGVAHSVEAWRDDELVGGLFGIGLGRFFSGESQFHSVPYAGQVAFVEACRLLQTQGYLLHDAQVLTPYLERFGAVAIPAGEFRAQQLRAIVQHAEFRFPQPAPGAEPINLAPTV